MVNVHYCMGAVASVSYGHEAPDSCGKCGMQEKAGCCHSELKVIKLDDEHQQAVKAAQLAQVAELPVVYFELLVADYSSRNNFVNAYHSPPDQRVNAIYLHSGVFRI